MRVIIVITIIILIHALVVVVVITVAVVIVVVCHGRCRRRRCRSCGCRRRHRAVVGSVSLVVRLYFDVESVSVESTDYDAWYDRVMKHIHSYTYVLS